MMVLQAGIVLLPKPDLLFRIQTHIAALVLHDFCLHIGTGSVGRGVHVGDQADGGQSGITGNRAVNIAVFIHVRIRNAHGQHLLHQGSAEDALLVRGGAGFGEFIGLGIKGHIF